MSIEIKKFLGCFVLFIASTTSYAIPQPMELWSTVDNYNVGLGVSELLVKSCIEDVCSINQYVSFDEKGRVLSVGVHAECKDFVTCSKKAGKYYIYLEDKQGRVESIISDSYGSKTRHEIKITKFDSVNRPLIITDKMIAEDGSPKAKKRSSGGINYITWKGESFISEACFRINGKCANKLNKAFRQYVGGNLVNIYVVRHGEVNKIESAEYNSLNKPILRTRYIYDDDAWNSNSLVKVKDTEKMEFQYDENGFLSEIKTEFNHTKFKNYQVDGCGNWISREVLNFGDFSNGKTIEQRELRYFETVVCQP